MRELSSLFMSMIAVVVSAVTTFLTFFDERYTLTAAIVDVGAGVQRSASYADGKGLDVMYQHYVEPTLILSNRGTRALVLTEVNLARSTRLGACEIDEVLQPIGSGVEPMIIEPGTVRTLANEYRISRVEAHWDARSVPASGADRLNAEHVPETWCTQLVVFDDRGRRMEPLMETLTLERVFTPPDEDDDYPGGTLELEHPVAAAQLLTRGAVF